jgi:hypothetical protein
MTRRPRACAALVALLLSPLCAWARGQADNTVPELVEGTENTVMVLAVTGRVRLVGNAPFAELVITDANEQDWYIDTDSRSVVASYEQRVVTVRGTLELLDMVLANGRRIGVRHILRDVQLIRALL